MADEAVLHRSRWVLPISAPPIENGAVLIASGRIRGVGPFDDLARDGVAQVDHGEAVLMPGLVNAHMHVELSALGFVPLRDGAGFGGWLGDVALATQTLDSATTDTAARSAMQHAVATGTVLVGDVSTRGAALGVLERSPLHARIFHELIGFDPRHAGTVIASAKRTVAEADAAASDPDRVRHALAAHAPYSVSSRLLRLIRGFNASSSRPTSIHLAESPDEDRFFQDGAGSIGALKERLGTTQSTWEAPGQSSVAYLSRLGWFESACLAVHCVQLGARGIEILERGGATACLCPRSNAALGVGVAPASALVAAGVPLALGTDSLASVESLDLFAEISAAARAYDGVAPEVWIRAATEIGARALGFDDVLGTLEVDKHAAVIAVSSDSTISDPFEFLVSHPDSDHVEHLDPRFAEYAVGVGVSEA